MGVELSSIAHRNIEPIDSYIPQNLQLTELLAAHGRFVKSCLGEQKVKSSSSSATKPDKVLIKVLKLPANYSIPEETLKKFR
ncbi:MAG: hypothetical protein MHPSP_001999, partial [Paramarteilia canceri]